MSTPLDNETAAARFRLGAQLHEAGIVIKRQQLKADHPSATDAQLKKILNDWLGHNGTPPGRLGGLVDSTKKRFG